MNGWALTYSMPSGQNVTNGRTPRSARAGRRSPSTTSATTDLHAPIGIASSATS
ncbi:hypothetical protein [Micromonospora sp. RHAY321]|uniref:hypothetical protein n=1 Tax=Micromonospora sp. RHAY321 TaxID=2944807 RepID=UPI0035AE957A